MKIKSLLIATLAILSFLPSSAQLRAPFRSESSGIGVVQLPSEKGRYRNLTVLTTQKASLGEGVANATERVSGAASRLGITIEDNTGALSDKTAPARHLQLIPNIFFAPDGDLLLEVTFYDEKMIKKSNIPSRWFDGETHEVKVEYSLYQMPEKKLIKKEGPFWVAGSGSSNAGPNQSFEDLYKDRLRIAQNWATEEVTQKYALGYKYIPIQVYTLRSLSGDDDRKQSEAQSNLVRLAGEFRRNWDKDEYKNEVKECIAIYEALLKQYSPGASRAREADINDNNVFGLYYNLTVAYYLIGDPKKAGEYAAKGMAVTKTEWEDVTNRNGDVIGRKRSGIQHVTEDIFHSLKGKMDAYYAGKSANNPTFVAMLTITRNLSAASRVARNTASNMHLSSAMRLENPVEIISVGLNENPKRYSGTVKKDGNPAVNFTVKKNIFAFIQKPKTYKATIATADGVVRTKTTFNQNMQPTRVTWDPMFNWLPARIDHGKVKTADPKTSALVGTRIMYDYNGDIVITTASLRDKWIYLNMKAVRVNENDALGVNKYEARVKLKNHTEVNTIDNMFTLIERERDVSFFKAVHEKWLKRDLPTTDISNDTRNVKHNVGADFKIVTKDEKGNWIQATYKNLEITRTLEY